MKATTAKTIRKCLINIIPFGLAIAVYAITSCFIPLVKIPLYLKKLSSDLIFQLRWLQQKWDRVIVLL